MSSQRLATQPASRAGLTRSNLKKSYGLEVQTGLLRKRLIVKIGMQPANNTRYARKANLKKPGNSENIFRLLPSIRKVAEHELNNL
jgi:hypothetical protein